MICSLDCSWKELKTSDGQTLSSSSWGFTLSQHIASARVQGHKTYSRCIIEYSLWTRRALPIVIQCLSGHRELPHTLRMGQRLGPPLPMSYPICHSKVKDKETECREVLIWEEKEISSMPNKMEGETTTEADKDGKLCGAPPKRRGAAISHLLCINLHLHTLCKKTCAVWSVTKRVFIVACRREYTHELRHFQEYASLGSRGCRVSAFAFQTPRSKENFHRSL